jgi:NAD-dependent DNA ligase
VKTRGAKSTSNIISKSTTLVVVGDKGGKKEKQAKELGVRVMDADEFMQIISL